MGQRWVQRGLVGLITGLCLWSRAGLAQEDEIAPFRLTGIEGNLSVRYLFDEFKTRYAGGGSSFESRPSFEEELFVMTHSYIYHPNFLKMDLGGGPVLVQSRLETDSASNRSEDTLYNLIARLNFLEQKPFPFTLYYEHTNPPVTLGPTDVFTQTTTKQGGSLSLLAPLMPVNVVFDAFEQETKGTGLNTVVDEKTQQGMMRMYRGLGDSGYWQFGASQTYLDSNSGSTLAPIVTTKTDTTSYTFDSRNLMGAKKQFTLTNVLSRTDQDYRTGADAPVANRDFRFAPDLRWDHSQDLFSYYRYNYYTSSQGPIDTTNQSTVMGLVDKVTEHLTATADVHGETNQVTGQTIDLYGAAGSLNYRKLTQTGSFQIAYGARYDYHDQVPEQALIRVVEEAIALSGVTRVPLVHAYVVESSVVVTNQARTQTYVRGTDYELETIGARTSIYRIPTGAITDGQTVLVSYDYQTQKVAYTVWDQSINTNWVLFRYYSLFAGYRDAPAKLVSGTPLFPLNSIKYYYYGGRLDVPFWDDAMVGGEARYEDQQDDVAPYNRQSFDAYVQLPVPYTSTTVFRVSGKRVIGDNIGSPEDVDLKGWGARLTSRLAYRGLLTAETNYYEDTGGTQFRRNRDTRLAAEWRIRQLTLTAEGRRTLETLGNYETERNILRALARRDF